VNQEEKMREEFEEWYSVNAFNLETDPIGSRDCGLQWKAWKAATAASLMAHEELQARIAQLEEALQKLSRLGNGDKLGNSIGNVIAQQALSAPPSEYLKQVRNRVRDECAQICESLSSRADCNDCAEAIRAAKEK